MTILFFPLFSSGYVTTEALLIDIGTANDDAHSLAGKPFSQGTAQCSCCSCTGRLDSQFHFMEEQCHCPTQIRIGDQDDLVNKFSTEGKAIGCGVRGAQTIRDGTHFIDGFGLARIETPVHGVGTFRFHAEDLAMGKDLFHRC